MTYDEYRALPNRVRAFVAVHTLKYLNLSIERPRELTREEADLIPASVVDEAKALR